jgi:hypothetical protein
MQISHLDTLLQIPQRFTIETVTNTLSQHGDVVALWLGGSLARNAGDIYSDIDYRVAIVAEQVVAWKEPPFEQIFAHAPVVAHQFLPFGEDNFLHHLVLANGEIFDFFVQSASHQPSAEPSLLLWSRDERLAQSITTPTDTPTIPTHTADGQAIKMLLIDFWVNTHKHCKVLHRELDLMITHGIGNERITIQRLWYIQASGKDFNGRLSIHSMMQMIRTIKQAFGTQAQEIIGVPLRTRAEIYQAIELHRTVVAQVGRQLAECYNFAYPIELEATVLRNWQQFREKEVH